MYRGLNIFGWISNDWFPLNQNLRLAIEIYQDCFQPNMYVYVDGLIMSRSVVELWTFMEYECEKMPKEQSNVALLAAIFGGIFLLVLAAFICLQILHKCKKKVSNGL